MKISISKNIKYYPGFFLGLRHPSIQVQVNISGEINFEEIKETNNLIEENLSIKSNILFRDNHIFILENLTNWLYKICFNKEISVFERSKIIKLNKNYYLIYIPYTDPRFCSLILKIFTNLVKVFSNANNKVHQLKILESINDIQIPSVNGSNVPKFFKAAYELNIPFKLLSDNLQQYGNGSNLLLMDSSFTENTSYIGSIIARNKNICNLIFKKAGIPVAKQFKIKSIEEIEKVIDILGFPLVIKPANLDGGKGVFAGLKNFEDIKNAFIEVSKLTKEVLIEKHIFGKDYRLNIFHGELLWAIERVPAGITGDGKHSIKELIQIINLDPRRGKNDTQSKLKILELDSEALNLIKEYNLKPSSILKSGIFLPLRRRANINSGGTPLAVFDKVHPDNADLAIRATKLLNLDISGVDIITEDISKSWKESGGVICEINAQPQLGGITSAHTYKIILNKLVKNKGRIPIIVLFGPNDSKISNKIKKFYNNRNLTVGCLDSKGISVGSKYLLEGKYSTYEGSNILMMNRDVDIVIINLNDISILNTGLPFDKYDKLILVGKNINFPKDTNISNDTIIEHIFTNLILACDGEIYKIKEEDTYLPNNLFNKSIKDLKANELLKYL